MRTITLLQPRRITFGNGCARNCVDDIRSLNLGRVFLVTSPPLLGHVGPIVAELRQGGIAVEVYSAVVGEPTIDTLSQALAAARSLVPDAVIGLGGGSCLDVAKLVAALHDSQEDVRQLFGVNLLAGRRTFLACLPTTAGTGSEVSTNAVLLDSAAQLKKTVVSPHLVPDAAYVDPLLTLTVPPALTATTGMDALVHCIEACANCNAHPTIDLYAFQGMRLIAANLCQAVAQGDNVEAREAMSLGSLYGGFGLGPVGVGAVHALAYPLGGEFHIAHGTANALLLPHVMEHNLLAMPERYAEIALALGAAPGDSPLATARRGLERVREISRSCGIPDRLSALAVPEEAIPRMAQAATGITRLMKNNPRELTPADAEAIYRAAY
ncbi:MAG: iron-containing alcohol dehydrogenase [Anaerolineae bacterium]